MLLVRNAKQVQPKALKPLSSPPPERRVSKPSRLPPDRFPENVFVDTDQAGRNWSVDPGCQTFSSKLQSGFCRQHRERIRHVLASMHQMCFIGFWVNWLRVPRVQPGDLLMAGEGKLIVTTSQKWPFWKESMLLFCCKWDPFRGAYKNSKLKQICQ